MKNEVLTLELDRKDFYKDKSFEKKRSAVKSARVLLLKSPLRNLICFKDINVYFFFNEEKKFYEELTRDGAIRKITSILEKLGDDELLEVEWVSQILRNLNTSRLYKKGTPKQPTTFIGFKNCIYSLRTKKLYKHNSRVLIREILPFEYKGFGETPIFTEFLGHVTEGYDDRIQVFRAMCRLAIEPNNSIQKFFYMHGKGGSGKSTVARVINALAGDMHTTSTTLALLGSNQFEHANFVSQKVVLVNDPGRGNGDHSALRCLVGGDKPVLRSKNVQGAGEGQIVVTVYMQSNYPFQSKDTSGAITRRIISIPIDKIPNKVKDLLSLDLNGNWVGQLVPELPYIMYWALEMTALEAKDVVMNINDKVPSLRDEQLRFALSSNSVEEFVNEFIIEGKGAFIGYKKEINERNTQNAKENGHIFYFYKQYCLDRELDLVSHKDFSKLLVEAAEKKGLRCKKIRKTGGNYISGIILDPYIFSAEYLTGELNEEEKENDVGRAGYAGSTYIHGEVNKLGVYPPTFVSPKPGEVHKSLTPNLINEYKSLFKESPLKRALNDRSKILPLGASDSIFDKCISEAKLRDNNYMASLRCSIDLSAGKLRKTGMLSYEMQSFGDSPRFQPLDTKYAVNNYKKSVNRLGLQLMALEAAKRGFTIVDLDLKSCYASTILGLFPQELTLLKKALEKGSLWDYIESEFDSWGRKSDYVKPYVKAAIYASCFGGGKDGLKKTILEKKRKELGLQEVHFKECSKYKEYVSQAENIGALVSQSNVFKSFKHVAKHFKTLYLNRTIVGPSGFVLEIDEVNVRSQYSNYLQDFERSVKCEFCIRLVKTFPGSELLIDLHDGITMAIPTDKLDKVKEFLLTETKEIGLLLGLQHPQVMEMADDSTSLLSDWDYEDSKSKMPNVNEEKKQKDASCVGYVG